jgi:hypothetical protein
MIAGASPTGQQNGYLGSLVTDVPGTSCPVTGVIAKSQFHSICTMQCSRSSKLNNFSTVHCGCSNTGFGTFQMDLVWERLHLTMRRLTSGVGFLQLKYVFSFEHVTKIIV